MRTRNIFSLIWLLLLSANLLNPQTDFRSLHHKHCGWKDVFEQKDSKCFLWDFIYLFIYICNVMWMCLDVSACCSLIDRKLLLQHFKAEHILTVASCCHLTGSERAQLFKSKKTWAPFLFSASFLFSAWSQSLQERQRPFRNSRLNFFSSFCPSISRAAAVYLLLAPSDKGCIPV